MERELNVIPAISDAIAIGTKNAVSLVIVVLLYVLTVWIPYLNVGTTIAMNTIPSKLAQGEIIDPTFIFDSIYRRRMGSFFLLQGLIGMMMAPAIAFLVIPAIVLYIMYSLALYIMLDSDVTPTTALELSNKATYGFKWKIFGIGLLYAILFGIVYALVTGIAVAIHVTFITVLLMIVLAVLGITCGVALNAVIYRNLYLNPKKNEELQEAV